MNKAFNIGARQRQHNVFLSQKYQKKQLDDTNQPPFYKYNGHRIFSYKGIVIEKGDSVYKVAQRIVISGFPVDSVEGLWIDGLSLRYAIDYALEKADPERHEAATRRFRNWECPSCNVFAWVNPKHITPVWEYKTDGQGKELRVKSGRKILTCQHCSKEVDASEIPYAPNDLFI